MSFKRLVIFGSGSTAFLNMPTTKKQEELFNSLFFTDGKEREGMLRSLLCSGSVPNDKEEVERIQSILAENKRCIDFIRCFFKKGTCSPLDLYNLIDIQINAQNDLRYYIEDDKLGVFSLAEIIGFRKIILSLLQEVFKKFTDDALKNPKFINLKSFFMNCANIMLDKKFNELKSKNVDTRSKDFIYTDTGYISFNWDILFLWAMFNAHKGINNSNKFYFAEGNNNLKLKIFNDFFTVINTIDVTSKNKGKDWFPYDMPAAYRINDSEHLSDRKVVLVPVFFPHGQTNWLECPQCGKLTMYIDGMFKLDSENMTLKNGDRYTCSHCGYKGLTTENSSMLLQTQYKIKAPYIEEIQRSMKNFLFDAQELIFVGYSLNDDDVDYRSVFRTIIGKSKKVYVVLHDSIGYDGWIPYRDLDTYGISKDNTNTAKRYERIFGGDNIFFNFKGFPYAADIILDIVKK